MTFSSFRGSPMIAVNVLSASVTPVFVPFSTRGTSKFVGVAAALAAVRGPPEPVLRFCPSCIRTAVGGSAAEGKR